ncbi:NUDIX domain [Geosmithia morbida]|uniref:NUDIX domain n=1 Tax=Geosmithia morbida TaxID=1094350 RepID=A0A9P4YWE1_9HYPO|nr:NUDIX domain [Geosmithia morbida]KAF4122908.1 NUDIX domain [Geosmithia morbida]
MSRTVKLTRHNVPVTIPDGLTEDQLLAFRPFNTWIDTLSASARLQTDSSHPFHDDAYTLRSAEVQSFDIFGSGRLGFIKLRATVCNSAGETLPAVSLLRGPSVAILVMLVPDDVPAKSDERYVVLTVQPRIPVGSFKGAAAKEIEEELGITINEDELTCLSDLAAADNDKSEENLPNAMYPSAGGCDEHVTIYSYERRIPREQLRDWSGRLTGLRSHGEKITLKVVPMQNLWREGARDAKALGALALWDALRRNGKI